MLISDFLVKHGFHKYDDKTQTEIDIHHKLKSINVSEKVAEKLMREDRVKKRGKHVIIKLS